MEFVTATVGLVVVLVPVIGYLWPERDADEYSAPVRHATITKTPKMRGIKTRIGPSKSSPYTSPKRHLPEGRVVTVECQVRDGEPLSDPGEGRPVHAVAAWDKLSTGDWINDLYTDLPQKRGPNPPKGVKRCPEEM